MKFPCTINEAIARAKREIIEDVENGFVPSHVQNFAELHDHRDANYYGGAFEWPDEDVDASVDEFCEFWNTVQDALDAWIRAGGLAAESSPVEPAIVMACHAGDR